jgi:hypothetical protein
MAAPTNPRPASMTEFQGGGKSNVVDCQNKELSMLRRAMMSNRLLVVSLVVGMLAGTGNAAGAQPADSFHALADFGPLDTPAHIEATFEKAVHELRDGDGGTR